MVKIYQVSSYEYVPATHRVEGGRIKVIRAGERIVRRWFISRVDAEAHAQGRTCWARPAFVVAREVTEREAQAFAIPPSAPHSETRPVASKAAS